MKRFISIAIAVFFLVVAAQVWAQMPVPGDVGSPECARLQKAVQDAVGDEDPDIYRNHGIYVSAAAKLVDPHLVAGEITEECASCIVNQFARFIPIAEQEPCGPLGETRNILGPDVAGNCGGEPVGTLNINDLGADGLQVEVEFTAGPPNTTSTVYWVCTLIPNGCHGDACGYISLGNVTTDASGYASFTATLPEGNPYPGQYVHFDIGGPPWYTSVWDIVFPAMSAGESALSEGIDPALE